MKVNKQLLNHIPRVGFGLILGDIRTGKSVLGYALLEAMGQRGGRDMLVYGLPKAKKHLLPKHIVPVYQVSDLREHSVFLCDEAYMKFYSREWQKDTNKLIDTLAGLAGQKDMLGLFITHQSRELDVGVVSSLQFLLYKKPSLLQHRFERAQMRPLTEEAYTAFQEYSKEQARKHTYVYFPDYVGLIEDSNTSPEWWTEELSKAYAKVDITEPEQEARLDLQKRILCLHCNQPAVGICSKCQCSVCQKHFQKLHSHHGTLEPLPHLRSEM